MATSGMIKYQARVNGASNYDFEPWTLQLEIIITWN